MSKFLAWCRNPNKRKRTATSLHGQIYHWACLLRDGTKDNYGATPMVPANIMLKLAERIWERRHVR
jgi:hypothetical protein